MADSRLQQITIIYYVAVSKRDKYTSLDFCVKGFIRIFFVGKDGSFYMKAGNATGLKKMEK